MRARRAAGFAALLLALGSGGSRVSAAENDAAVKACYAKAIATVDISDCQTLELAGVELQLNAAYKAALATLPDDQRAKLVAAERLWVSFRKSDCDVFYGRETGTIAALESGSCLIDRARARLGDLKAFRTP